ncbi:MAG: hypothetical protein IIX20_05885, partial [Alistipes sp.]|nr:hypothetical protein [Alistipes sp.]
ICDFEAPFDIRFRDMMAETVKTLMDYGFRVIYGFTESDEISMSAPRRIIPTACHSLAVSTTSGSSPASPSSTLA